MATKIPKKTCPKCGRCIKETFFYKRRNGERVDLCRDCLTMYVDNRKPSTFTWILKDLDVPYIESMWIDLANKAYQKDPANFGPLSVIGTYVRVMKMTPWQQYGYEQSDEATALRDHKNDIVDEYLNDEDRIAALKEKLDNGEISEAEFKTFTQANPPQKTNPVYSSSLLEDESEKIINGNEEKEEDEGIDASPPEPQEQVLELVTPPPDDSIDLGFEDIVNEDSIASELTKDDIKYLGLKWGTAYKPTEWVKLEEMYKKYESEYELNVDRAEVLQSVCKTKLKMDQSLDIGDFKTYKDLSAVYDQLRKSGKFTESQNVETQKREIDSIGELVAFVENKGGIIPRFEDPENEPQDKIDFLIKDMKNYVNNLVRNELGLGNLIESYVKKLKEQEIKTAEDLIQEGIDLSIDEGDGVTQEEAEEFQAFQMDEIEEESRRLVEAYGAL